MAENERKQRGLLFVTGRDERTDRYTGQWIQAAQKHAIPAHVIDYRAPETFRGEMFRAFLEAHDCVMITFHGDGSVYSEEGGNYWEHRHIPVYSMMTRYTREDAEVLEHPVRDFHVLTANRSFETLLKRVFPEAGDAHFLPCGGIVPEEATGIERDIDVLILDSCERERSSHYDKIPFLDEEGVTMITACVADMINRPEINAQQAMEAYFASGAEQCDDAQFTELLKYISEDIEWTARRFFKLEMLHALDRQGISVEIHGSDWEAPDYILGEQIRVFPEADAAEAEGLRRRAKIVISFSPWAGAGEGCHAEAFDAMLSGALCITESNPWLAGRFQDGVHLVFMDHDNPNQAAADIQYLLANPERLREIADSGLAAVAGRDTWEQRLLYILDLIEKGDR